MSAALDRIRFSVLDRSLVREGEEPGEALRATVAFAREAEALGYHRFWVAEHHGVPGVAGSAPTVLAAAVAAATSRIRVGTGGVMLPNHRPLVVAEQFGVLESLFPGRIDMGLGRSVGFTDGVRRALGTGREAADGFAGQLTELIGYFTGAGSGTPGAVRAQPSRGLRVPAFILATGSGAEQAAAAGLPLVIAAPRGTERMLQAVADYRAAFRPSQAAQRPYVVVAVSVAVARTAELARRMQLSEAWSSAWSRTHGVFPPLAPPGAVPPAGATDRERALLEESLEGQIHGTEEQVAEVLGDLVERSGADEVLVTLSAHDRAQRLDSYRRLAALAGLPGRG